jgi:hypothetical protein
VDEQKRIKLLERLIHEQSEVIKTQRERIDQQQTLIESQQSELKRRGKTRTLPKGPGLWVVSKERKQSGRRRDATKEEWNCFFDWMRAFKEANSLSWKDAFEIKLTEVLQPRTRYEKSKIAAKAVALENRARNRSRIAGD